MPPKTKKKSSSSSSRKGGKGKKSSKVVPGHGPEEMPLKQAENQPVPEPEPWKAPSDPWKKHRSVYGGGLSPAEQWDMLVSNYKGKEEVEVEASGWLEGGGGLKRTIDRLREEESVRRVAKEQEKEKEREREKEEQSLDEEGPKEQDSNEQERELKEQGAKEELNPPPPTPLPPLDTLILHSPPTDQNIPPSVLYSLVTLTVLGGDGPLDKLLALNKVPTNKPPPSPPPPLYIRSLTLSSFNLTNIPNLSCFPKLLSLAIPNNDLSGVTLTPETWSGLENLRLLSLQGCGLTKVFSSLTTLSNLKVLDVSSNALDPPELSLLISLPLPFKRSLTSLTILPNPFSTDPELPSITSNLLKSLPCLNSFQGVPFSHTVSFDTSLLSSLSLLSNDVEATDSSTCSCVFGNPCLTKDTCKTWIWHRKEEIAERARKEADFDPEMWLKGPQD
ncbi:hypothetical protein TrCOL_g9284 [Triparma columacea]|uniref:Uncharacterized protein n=1 Tax=Triparma columacea TaxID=722753 RepID=A0A9W7GK98_9STRA|nr:hypothetical protein TrCOL_g9284 [Triparma columacea]